MTLNLRTRGRSFRATVSLAGFNAAPRSAGASAIAGAAVLAILTTAPVALADDNEEPPSDEAPLADDLLIETLDQIVAVTGVDGVVLVGRLVEVTPDVLTLQVDEVVTTIERDRVLEVAAIEPIETIAAPATEGPVPTLRQSRGSVGRGIGCATATIVGIGLAGWGGLYGAYSGFYAFPTFLVLAGVGSTVGGVVCILRTPNGADRRARANAAFVPPVDGRPAFGSLRFSF